MGNNILVVSSPFEMDKRTPPAELPTPPPPAQPEAVPERAVKRCFLCSEEHGEDESCPMAERSLAAVGEQKSLRANYEFLGVVGAGGMGIIYKARQKMLKKTVAIKMLHYHLVTERTVQRFQIEGQAASRLRHPYIVAVHDSGLAESGQPYMVMDFLDGETLEQIVQREGALPAERVVRIFIQVAEALSLAHKQSVVHRDIKPSNLMMVRNEDGKEEVRIMDFGIAKLLNEAGGAVGRLTETGTPLGSPLYMSPEQVRGAELTTRSDLYSLGCVMFEALTGLTPFYASSPFEVMLMHVKDTEKAPTLTQATLGNKVFDPELERIVARLLEKEADNRYRSMDELRVDLLSFQNNVRVGKSLGRIAIRLSRRERRKRRLVLRLAIGSVLGALALFAGICVCHSWKRATPPVVATSPLSTMDLVSEVREIVERAEPEIDLSDIERSMGSLNLFPTPVTDYDILPLERAGNVTSLSLRRSRITDAGLEHINKLNLQKLDLSGTNVVTLKPIRTMSSLKSLDLSKSALGSEGMSVLRGLPNLEILSLDETGIHDSDLRALAALPRLRWLSLRNCSHLTAAGVNSLHQLLPRACALDFKPANHPNIAQATFASD